MRDCRRLQLLALCAPLLLLFAAGSSYGAPPRVYSEGELPKDARLGELKHLNAYFPFKVPTSKMEWDARRAELQRRILVATGLWPMPEKTPLNPVIHGKVERDGFTVEKVYFESLPGHYVTGLLFRPKGQEGKLPAVLCPHGHGGRLQDYGAGKMAALIASGAEKFEDSGRYPKLSRCVQLARMGCISFIFDMEGYADSVQIPHSVIHRFATQRPELDTKMRWGLYSTQAELRLQSVMGLQTWNSIRALDFLCSLMEVDQKRIGVTGGSGGGTQTILLCAIDPRPIVAFPNGMVSTAMQGGCTCENCSLLRIGTGNVELAALFAPKPQGMTAANDWTKEMMTKGYPELKQLYKMLGVPDDVECHEQLHFPHNYNYVTRAHMYKLFGKHLKLGLVEPIIEGRWKPLTPEEWTVWNDKHPKPEVTVEHEVDLLKKMDRASHKQLTELAPTDKKSLAEYRRVVGGAFATIIGRTLNDVGPIEREKVGKRVGEGYLLFTDILRTKSHGEELPVVSLFPTNKDWNGRVVIWIDGKGKSGLFDDSGTPRPEIRKLLESGASVLSADLLFQGEFLKDGKPITETRKVANNRQFAGYTFGYNHTLFARRVHDILTLISFVRNDEHGAKQVDLVGVSGAGPWAAAALAVSGDAIDRAAIDTGGFRFANLKSYRDMNFLPGALKYGDLPGLLSLCTETKLLIVGEGGGVPDIVAATFQSAGASDGVDSAKGKSIIELLGTD